MHTPHGTRTLTAIPVTALLALAMGTGIVSAGEARNAENTFTKWFPVGPPNMAGVVDGDVGTGTYAGEILSFAGSGTPTDPILITADYHFYGAQHSFTARVDVVEIGTEATISGIVTEGWLKGNVAVGGFTVVQCTHDGVTTMCFTGYLDILRGTKAND